MKFIFKPVLVICLLVIFGGCRKEIIHEIGVRKIKAVEEPVAPGTTWNLVSGSPESIFTLCSHEGKLFIGGEFEETSFDHFCSFSNDRFSKGLTGNFIGDGVYDIQAIGSRLWVGGNFSYLAIGRDYDNLVYIDPNSYGGLNFGEWIFTDIFGLTEHQGDLYVRGYITTNRANIKTSHIEKVRGTNIIGFEQGISEPINDFTFFQNKMYVAGDDNFEPDVHLFGFWDNSKWNPVGDIDRSSILDRAYAVEVYDGELYMAGDESFKRPTSVQKFDGSSYTNIEEIQISTCKMKVIGGTLYLFGKGILLNGVGESNVVKYSGGEWEPVGDLTREITDVEVYNGSLYAGTSRGLYILE